MDSRSAWEKCCAKENVKFAKRGTVEYERVLLRFKLLMKKQSSNNPIVSVVEPPKKKPKSVPKKNIVPLTLTPIQKQTRMTLSLPSSEQSVITFTKENCN